MEQQPLHDLQAGKAVATPERLDAATQMILTPMATLNCPSRRPATVFPCLGGAIASYAFTNTVDRITANDYAVNTGDVYGNDTMAGHGGPGSIAEAESATFRAKFQDAAATSTGVVWQGGAATIADITDGLSNTYLFGEKLLNPDSYCMLCSGEADGNSYIGHHPAIARWTFLGGPYPPKQDMPGVVDYYRFGSAHAGACNFVFCDGSAHAISYEIDPDIHHSLGNRKDGQPIDARTY